MSETYSQIVEDILLPNGSIKPNHLYERFWNCITVLEEDVKEKSGEVNEA